MEGGEKGKKTQCKIVSSFLILGNGAARRYPQRWWKLICWKRSLERNPVKYSSK